MKQWTQMRTNDRITNTHIEFVWWFSSHSQQLKTTEKKTHHTRTHIQKSKKNTPHMEKTMNITEENTPHMNTHQKVFVTRKHSGKIASCQTTGVWNSFRFGNLIFFMYHLRFFKQKNNKHGKCKIHCTYVMSLLFSFWNEKQKDAKDWNCWHALFYARFW